MDIWRPLNPRKRRFADMSTNKSNDDASLPTNDEDDIDGVTLAIINKKNTDAKGKLHPGKFEAFKGKFLWVYLARFLEIERRTAGERSGF